MKILFIGDIVARIGRRCVQQVLPDLIKQKAIDFVIAQSENLTTGNGLTIEAVNEMREAGVNFFTGGNHTWKKSEFNQYLDDKSVPVIRPANYPEGVPGRGYDIVDTDFGRILIVSLLGQIVGAAPQVDNPLATIDRIMGETANEKLDVRILDFHGDYSSEKVGIGLYLDGKFSAVFGTHTHVPTADARILPGGTAVITDAGMVGPHNTVLGVKPEIILDRWKTQMPRKHEVGDWPCEFDSVLVETDQKGHATSIEQIRKIVDNKA